MATQNGKETTVVKMPALPEWSAAQAKNSIAIVTIDAKLEARIRTALQGESYELITVDDFKSNQSQLVDTMFGIFDARNTIGYQGLKFVRMSHYWSAYLLIGIYTREGLAEQQKIDRMWSYDMGFDIKISDDFAGEELLSLARRLIKAIREVE